MSKTKDQQNLIEIRGLFGKWYKCSDYEAYKYIIKLLDRLSISGNKAYEYINKKRLRGISVEELLYRYGNKKSS